MSDYKDPGWVNVYLIVGCVRSLPPSFVLLLYNQKPDPSIPLVTV